MGTIKTGSGSLTAPKPEQEPEIVYRQIRVVEPDIGLLVTVPILDDYVSSIFFKFTSQGGFDYVLRYHPKDNEYGKPLLILGDWGDWEQENSDDDFESVYRIISREVNTSTVFTNQVDILQSISHLIIKIREYERIQTPLEISEMAQRLSPQFENWNLSGLFYEQVPKSTLELSGLSSKAHYEIDGKLPLIMGLIGLPKP